LTYARLCYGTPRSIIKVAPLHAVNLGLNKFSHNHGLNAARLALAMAGSFASAGAKEVHTDISVTATVRAVANIDLQSTPAALEISASDVRRGYIDVPQPTQLIVRSNSPTGFSLDVLSVAPIFSAMVIQGLDSNTELGADGGSVVQRWQRPQAINLSLRFRFALAPGVTPGIYPWPVRMAVRPLESI
jgi:hypothetical protein